MSKLFNSYRKIECDLKNTHNAATANHPKEEPQDSKVPLLGIGSRQQDGSGQPQGQFLWSVAKNPFLQRLVWCLGVMLGVLAVLSTIFTNLTHP